MNPFTYYNIGEILQSEESKEASEKKIQKERRTFLKKAVYKAPALVVLGSLAKPTVAMAISNPPNPSKGFVRP